MNKKILIGSIIAVTLLTLVSFSSVVGFQSVKSDLDTSVEENAIPIEFKLQRIRDLVQSIDLWKIIVNPDALVDTLEEVSSILEEEDVRNYIEKTSDEDCGCEDDSTEFKWFFPVICTLLFPIWFVVIFIFFSSHRMFGALLAETMAQIGHDLNCFWKLG